MVDREGSIIAEIAEQSRVQRSRIAFRAEALSLIARHVHSDGALFDTLDPSAPVHHGAFRDLDLRCIDRARAGWASCYAAELAPLAQCAARAGGVVIDSRVFGQRERARRRYFSEVTGPERIGQVLWVHLDVRGESVSAIGLCRSATARPFDDRDAEAMRALSSVLALADGSFLLPRRAAPVEVPLPRLTPREREIADLAALGYTNKEIALSLGSSANTVRNQLAGLFQKVGVSTRAELVGLMARSGAPR
jgi:DNA-binding CsgD family transcriptional regulator